MVDLRLEKENLDGTYMPGNSSTSAAAVAAIANSSQHLLGQILIALSPAHPTNQEIHRLSDIPELEGLTLRWPPPGQVTDRNSHYSSTC